MTALQLVFAGILSLFPRFTFYGINRRIARSKASQQHNCAESPKLPSIDPIFGLDTVAQSFHQLSKHRMMRSLHELYQQYGHTFQSTPFGRRSVSTIHPRNLPLIANENNTFGAGSLRELASEPMLGRIASSDRAMWLRARTMLKPTFNRAQIADREMFSIHIKKFLQLLPHDSSEVGLQPLFDHLVRYCSTPQKMA